MGLRFRKSFKLAPGLRLNMSKSGFGFSVGPRGASMSFGPKGTYQSVNLPGGFSFRDRIGGGEPSRQSASSTKIPVNIAITLQDDGTVVFNDSVGNPLAPHLQELAKKQQGGTVKDWLAQNCEEINSKIEQLDTLHLQTPAPSQKPVFVPSKFAGDPPRPPLLKEVGLLSSLLPWARQKIETENAKSEAEYNDRMNTWRECKATHDKAENDRRILLEERLYKDQEAMQEVLKERLEAIHWPRETNMATEIADDGRSVVIDIDLPEIEDIPRKTAKYSGRGWKVTIKELSESKVTQLYMRHIHAIAFRVLGETFAALPTVQQITLSGYSQRPDKATGQLKDDYLYSIKVSRDRWSELHFANLIGIDVIESVSRFDLRREMSKSGKFTPVEPFAQIHSHES